MISDNFVTGDNVYLNELKNFFFEVLGMMSITHYGCIGDGRFDNYASLQVAIEDAHRRGLKYIYVPGGRYRYRGNLLHLEGITFIGNSRAKIFNDRTGEEIPIVQFALGDNSYFEKEYTYMINRGYYIDIPAVGERIDLTPIPGENVAYFLSPIKGGEIYYIYGTGATALLDSDLKVVEGWDFNAVDDYFPIGPYDTDFNGYIVVSFDHTDEHEPHLWHAYDLPLLGIQPLLTAGRNITIDDNNVISATGGGSGGIGDTITAYLTTDQSITPGAFTRISFDSYNSSGSKLSLSNGGVVVGSDINKVLVSADVHFVANNSATTLMVQVKKNNTTMQVAIMNEGDEHTLSLTDKLIDVTQGDTISVEAYVYGGTAAIDGDSNGTPTYFTVKAVGGSFSNITFLEDFIYLTNGTAPQLAGGAYFTNDYAVFANGDVVIPRGTTFYYDETNDRFVWASGYLKNVGGTWIKVDGVEPDPPMPPTPEEDEMKAIITTTLEENLTASQGANPVYMDNYISGGTTPALLTLSDSEHGSTPGVVIIGQGVTKVKVSGLLSYKLDGTSADATAGRSCAIYKYIGPGETDVRIVRADNTVKNISNEYYNISIAPTIVEVQPGNEIYLAGLFFNASDTIDTKSYLTVEVVDYTSN